MTTFREPNGWSAAVASVVGWVVWIGVAGTVVSQTSGPAGGSASDEWSESGETDAEELRERVEHLLSGYHFTPDRETFDEVASDREVAGTLRGIAGDETARPSMRSRAVDVLALYPSEETESFLASYLDPPPEDVSEKRRRAYEVVRLHAIGSLADIREGERAVETLEGLLAADDLQVRLMVVTALGEHGGEAGARRLRKLARETDDDVMEREIRKYLKIE